MLNGTEMEMLRDQAAEEHCCLHCSNTFEMEEGKDEDGGTVFIPEIPVEGIEDGTGYCSESCKREHLFGKLPAGDQEKLRWVYALLNSVSGTYLSPQIVEFLEETEAGSVQTAIREAEDAACELNHEGTQKWADDHYGKSFRMVPSDLLVDAQIFLGRMAYRRECEAQENTESAAKNSDAKAAALYRGWAERASVEAAELRSIERALGQAPRL